MAREAAGAEVEEYYTLLEPVAVQGEVNGACTIWGERIKVLDEANTRTLARYGAGLGWLTGQPAVTVHSYHTGKVYLVGLASRRRRSGGALQVWSATPGSNRSWRRQIGVEACLRVTPDGRPVYILINQSGQPQQVHAQRPLSQPPDGRARRRCSLRPMPRPC